MAADVRLALATSGDQPAVIIGTCFSGFYELRRFFLSDDARGLVRHSYLCIDWRAVRLKRAGLPPTHSGNGSDCRNFPDSSCRDLADAARANVRPIRSGAFCWPNSNGSHRRTSMTRSPSLLRAFLSQRSVPVLKPRPIPRAQPCVGVAPCLNIWFHMPSR